MVCLLEGVTRVRTRNFHLAHLMTRCLLICTPLTVTSGCRRMVSFSHYTQRMRRRKTEVHDAVCVKPATARRKDWLLEDNMDPRLRSREAVVVAAPEAPTPRGTKCVRIYFPRACSRLLFGLGWTGFSRLRRGFCGTLSLRSSLVPFIFTSTYIRERVFSRAFIDAPLWTRTSLTMAKLRKHMVLFPQYAQRTQQRETEAQRRRRLRETANTRVER